MSGNIVNRVDYLRTTRNFPTDAESLSVEVNRSYLDIAAAVNSRVIGLFAVNRPSITGESWFLTGARQQTLRQVYTFTSAGNIAHGINLSEISAITRLYGIFTDGSSNWFTLPYVDVTAVNNQISLTMNATNIVITAGADTPPTIASGTVVVEWLAVV